MPHDRRVPKLAPGQRREGRRWRCVGCGQTLDGGVAGAFAGGYPLELGEVVHGVGAWAAPAAVRDAAEGSWGSSPTVWSLTWTTPASMRLARAKPRWWLAVRMP